MRMNLDQDEALRLKGWRVFRSASRDHMIPQTGAGAMLQRVKVAEALPSRDTTIGITLTIEERDAIANQRRLDLALAERESVSKSIGVTKYFPVVAATVTGNPSALDVADESIIIGTAPFDGFVTELVFTDGVSANVVGLAIKSSGGESMFRAMGNHAFAGVSDEMDPDFLSRIIFSNLSGGIAMRNLHMPVFSGEQLILTARLLPLSGAGLIVATFVLGFESFTLARAGSAAAVSAFGAIASASRISATEAAKNATAIELARQKTLQLSIQQQTVAQKASQGEPTPGPSGLFVKNPLTSGAFNEFALRAVSQRIPTPAPPPKVALPKPLPPEGAGLTFVSAWNPSYGSIGYLIPDPPVGGRVNVFDNQYSIFDISGRLTKQGPIIPVAGDQDIPAGARISPVRGAVLPGGLTPAS